MREHPILFSAPMVRAILEGRKSMTRRVVKPYRKHQIVNLADAEPTLGYSGRHNDPDSWGYEFLDDGAPAPLSAWPELCPYGQPGDQLWVREAWMVDAPRDGTWADFSFYGCKGSPLSEIPERYRKPEHCLFRATWDGFDMVGWKPSIHMPRWASRITLEVTGVRVERLQDISEADAIAEGSQPKPWGPWWQGYKDMGGMGLVHQELPGESPPEWMIEPKRMKDRPWLDRSASSEFRALWQSINGADSWDANPWVWAVAFKPVQS